MMLSKSKINTFLRCPRSFKYIYIDKLEDEIGEAAQIGLDVHEYAENIAKELMNQETITEDLILEIMLKLYPFEEEEFDDDNHAQSLYTFFTDALVEQNYKIFGVEGRVDDEEDQLRGIVDLILEDQETGELFVIDYKTGKVKGISNFRLELCIYRKLIEHKYPDRKVTSACIFFTKNASYKGFNFTESQKKGSYVTEEEYNLVFDLIDEIRNLIDIEYSSPKRDDISKGQRFSFCRDFCSFYEQCKSEGGR